MAGEVEELYISIRADYDQALQDARKGVQATERELGKLDQAGKKTETTFSKLGQAGKASFAAMALAVGLATGAVLALVAGIQQAYAAAQAGIQTIRTRSGFNSLAASAGQSSQEILKAMREASAGTIADADLMLQANTALQLGVAKTPEEFEKLTRSAVTLGRAMGKGPVMALNDLINAAGRRSTEVLDNLGISLSEVNTEMERMAEQQFGKSAASLDAAQRNALFMASALEVASRQADKLGDGIDDVGSSMEQAQARVQNFTASLNEGFTLLFSQSVKLGTGVFETFFGTQGVVPLVEEGSNALASFFAALIAGFTAAAGTIAQRVVDTRKVFTGQMSIGDYLDPGRVADDIVNKYNTAFEKLKVDYAEILRPGSTGPTGPVTPPGIPDPGVVEDTADRVKELLAAAGADLAELQEKTEIELETSASEHNDKMLEIESEYTQARLALGSKLADDLEALDSEVVKRRAEIFADTRSELTEVEANTNQALQDGRAEFEEQERRQTEDHLRAMRQLRERYLQDLQGAVEQRDARAIVDLRRQFQQESQQQEETFDVRQDRERQDQDRRLQEIRDDERRRTDEILQAQQDRLAELRVYESERDAEIRAGFQQELTALDEKHNQELAKEKAAWEAKQAELNSALDNRLAELAQQYASELELTEAQAQEVLGRLNKFYGEDGSITKLYEEFAARRRHLLELTGEEEEPDLPSVNTGPGGRTRRSSGRSIPGFASGGEFTASRPTLIAVGENWQPERVSITPVRNMSLDRQERAMSLSVDLNFRGDVPGNLTGDDKNKIAGVLVEALRQAGMQ